jgi:hypothetical protein
MCGTEPHPFHPLRLTQTPAGPTAHLSTLSTPYLVFYLQYPKHSLKQPTYVFSATLPLPSPAVFREQPLSSAFGTTVSLNLLGNTYEPCTPTSLSVSSMATRQHLLTSPSSKASLKAHPSLHNPLGSLHCRPGPRPPTPLSSSPSPSPSPSFCPRYHVICR